MTALLGLRLVALALSATLPSPRQTTITVSPTGAVRSVGEAIRRAAPGARIVVERGTYREPMIVVDRSVIIEGRPGAVLDGEGERQIMRVTADGVTIRGLTFAHVGMSFTDDMAALKVDRARGCTIENNRVEDGFFGIYLADVTGCRVANNELHASRKGESSSGNGIHLWTSRQITIEDNRVSGYRDGIYFEFVHESLVRRNLSEGNLRYGLHFMYSDNCRYLDNTFRRNGAGVAVMYTKYVEMTGNRFEDNWGSAAYGLLLKEITEPRLVRNHFVGNTVGLFADGATRLVADGNEFTGNGWAVKLMASTYEARFTGNSFRRNTFDVATNSRDGDTEFRGNYFDTYAGYDLDRDGWGDVPHRPVRLFSVVAEQNPPVLILLRSAFLGLLEAAERVLPSLTPGAMADPRPAMHPLS